MCAKGFGGGETLLGAEAVEEGELQWSGFGQVDRLEVEEVGFDGKGVCAEGRAVAGVGDAAEELVAYAEGCDVDAVGWQEFRIRSEVDGWDGVAGAVASAAGGDT